MSPHFSSFQPSTDTFAPGSVVPPIEMGNASMTIASALGFGNEKKVRYALVGLGDITQAALLPGVRDTGNSTITALITGDPLKARKIGEKYGVSDHYDYDQFAQAIASGRIDAIYLGTPNWRHAEFIIPALEAGVHVLTEKPLEISSKKCAAIIDAARVSSAKLMVAYRLHFEPATLSTIQMIREGSLGELLHFSSVFAQMLDPENHRAKNGVKAGPLFDMGPYPINAARYIFGAEPIEVISAVSTRHAGTGFVDLDDTISVTLRFPQNKIAQFVVSYFANAIDAYTVVGTKGSIEMNPGFTYHDPLEQHVIVGDKKSHKSHKLTDQFAGEMKYFSNCILQGLTPEADAEEGLIDVQIIEAILRAVDSGKPEVIDVAKRTRRIDIEAQLEKLSANAPPELVHAASPARKDS